jgi:hypothetical protein
MAESPIEHKDKLGQLLKIGDCVVYSSSNSLEIGTIKKLYPKMIKVWSIGAKPKFGWYRGQNKYPSDTILLDSPGITMYLLTHS